MHPDDAAQRGISDSGEVRVFNERGELHLSVQLDNGIKPGCVCLTNGWWISEGGAVNFLSAARETDIGYGAAFHDNRVQVEAVSGAE
jgi:anaerobic selenocysteine-containing dehydrogenase